MAAHTHTHAHRHVQPYGSAALFVLSLSLFLPHLNSSLLLSYQYYLAFWDDVFPIWLPVLFVIAIIIIIQYGMIYGGFYNGRVH